MWYAAGHHVPCRLVKTSNARCWSAPTVIDLRTSVAVSESVTALLPRAARERPCRHQAPGPTDRPARRAKRRSPPGRAGSAGACPPGATLRGRPPSALSGAATPPADRQADAGRAPRLAEARHEAGAGSTVASGRRSRPTALPTRAGALLVRHH